MKNITLSLQLPFSHHLKIAIVIMLVSFGLCIARPTAAQSDSTLQFSTYLGGSEPDVAEGITIDNAGNVYVVGESFGADFPASGVFPVQSPAIFVTKFDSSGRNILYSIFLGGGIGYAIEVDEEGYAYVAGMAFDLVTVNAYQPDYHGGWDAFIAKLDPAGEPVFLSYLGGTGQDYALSLALDAAGNIALTGITTSLDFPVQNAYRATKGSLGYDIFVTKMNASGSALIFSTYYGGVYQDFGRGVVVDSAGNVYVTGDTDSNIRMSAHAFQDDRPPGINGFVTKFSATGALVFATYLGGNGHDRAYAITLDAGENVVVVGYTSSNNFPIKDAYQTTNVGGTAFVTRLSSDGSQLLYSTYLGGTTGESIASDVAIDSLGSIFVSGITVSADFPVVYPFQAVNPGSPHSYKAFVTRFHPNGQSLQFSTYLGGSSLIGAYSAFLDINQSNSIYITGVTYSDDFPILNAFQPIPGGGGIGNPYPNHDAFITQIKLLPAIVNVPQHNYFTTPTPVFNWSEISWATAYQVEVYALPQIGGRIVIPTRKYQQQVNTSELYMTSAPLDDGLYHWRIRARKPDGSWGVWSIPQPFLISTVLLS